MSRRITLLLVGAGHAHLEILRRLAHERPRWIEATVVSPGDRHFYSGMTPGYLAGTYTRDEISFDVAALAQRARVRHIEAEATGARPRERQVQLATGESIPYDIASFNVGSLLVGDDRPEVSAAARIKPLHRVEQLHEAVRKLAATPSPAPLRATVVGAGAAGIEVACALAAVLDRAKRNRQIVVLDGANSILAGYSPAFRRRVERALEELRIDLRLGSKVSGVTAESVVLDDGPTLPSDLTVWLTGPRGGPLFSASGLPTDERGFLLVDDRLRSLADERIFAVGDCATPAPYPRTPKAGVFALRQAPVLWHNLLATIAGRDLIRYTPQPDFLSILNTCDGRALLRYKRFHTWSHWAWWLKDWIDRRFVTKYQRLTR